jgi:hypothetical protein
MRECVLMGMILPLSWRVEAKKPPKWGRQTTKEEKEELEKEKHTPGKKEKMGRSQIKHERSPGRYAGRDKPGGVEEKGKRCGKSYIAHEDECHIGDVDKPKKGKSQDPKSKKKPRTKTVKPKGAKPQKQELPPVPKLREKREKKPRFVNSPEGGEGQLIGEGYLANGEDGVYAIGAASNQHRIYFPRVVDQAQAQYLSSAIAAVMGLASPEDYLFQNTPISQRVGTGHQIVPFTELDQVQLKRLASTSPEVAGYFVHAVLTRHDSVVGQDFNNMVMRRDGRVMVLHYGGTLLWTDLGKRRTDGMSPDRLTELETLRDPEINWQAASVFSGLSEQDITSAITEYLGRAEDEFILELVDAARFSPEDRAEIGKGLIARKHLLESMVGEQHE